MGAGYGSDGAVMGEMADLLREQEETELWYQRPPLPTKTVWMTKGGEEICIAKMGDGHLLNTIRFLRRRGVGEREKGTEFFDTMLKVARKRGLTK